jgi:hypothetical protein
LTIIGILWKELILTETEGLDRKQLISYLKQYKAWELITIAKSMELKCHDKETKIIALQKVVHYISLLRGIN